MIEVTKILSHKKTSIGMGTRFARHLIAGGVGMLFYIANTAVLVEIINLDPVTSAIVASVLTAAFNYRLSRLWVYNTIQGHGYSIPRFITAALIATVLNAGVMYFTVEILGLWYIMGTLIAAFIVPPTNFLLNFYWTFK